MLYTPPTSFPQLIRHRCRNPRCGLKLQSPTDKRLDAFCCATCFAGFYRSRCLVCERLFTRKTERRLICDRQKCRGEFRRHRERFWDTRYPALVLSHNGSRSAHSTGLKNGQKGDRPFQQVAGPVLSPISLRLASLPLDPEFAARLARVHAPYLDHLKRTKRQAARLALIKKRHPPVNILGGYRFPDAPVAEFTSIETPEWATSSRWVPSGAGADVPPIPEFLKARRPLAMPIPTTASLGGARRRFVKRAKKAELVLAAMEAGASLQLHYEGPPSRSEGPHWVLSDGRSVADDIARLVIQSASVIAVGDALFDGAPSQTWRWWRE